MTNRPMGPKDFDCPLHKKAMSKVCHTCPWWICVRGVHPQTGAEVDKWECAIALMPLLQIETSQQVRQGAAATESFRNEVVRRADSVTPLGVPHQAMPSPRLIQG